MIILYKRLKRAKMWNRTHAVEKIDSDKEDIEENRFLIELPTYASTYRRATVREYMNQGINNRSQTVPA